MNATERKHYLARILDWCQNFSQPQEVENNEAPAEPEPEPQLTALQKAVLKEKERLPGLVRHQNRFWLFDTLGAGAEIIAGVVGLCVLWLIVAAIIVGIAAIAGVKHLALILTALGVSLPVELVLPLFTGCAVVCGVRDFRHHRKPYYEQLALTQAQAAGSGYPVYRFVAGATDNGRTQLELRAIQTDTKNYTQKRDLHLVTVQVDSTEAYDQAAEMRLAVEELNEAARLQYAEMIRTNRDADTAAQRAETEREQQRVAAQQFAKALQGHQG